MDTFGSDYPTPGWQRAQARMKRTDRFDEDDPDYHEDTNTPASSGPRAHSEHRTRAQPGEGRGTRRNPMTIDGELVAKSAGHSHYAAGDRIFHQKFGYGDVLLVDGNKLTILFDKAGEKRVVDSFVERA
jgi:DNA helicase-2/ATP-dependent DNA helicase PcrA